MLYTFQTTSLVSIQPGARAEPYTIITATATATPLLPLSLAFPSSATATDAIQKIKNLCSISKSRLSGRDAEIEAKESLQSIVDTHEAAITFDLRSLSRSEQEQVLMQARGHQVSPLLIQPGWIVLTRSSLVFQPYSKSKSTTTSPSPNNIRFTLDAASRAGRRKFRLKDVSLEVFFGRKASIFLAFTTTEERNRFEENLRKDCTGVTKMPPPPLLRQLTKDWTAGKLSNFDYLSQLNEVAGRSFNDLTQYPVFPWVLQDYSSSTLDLLDPGVFRDLSKPVAALNDVRVQHAREMYAALKSTAATDGNGDDGGEGEEESSPPWMFGSHYSNPGFVVFYLLRCRPQLMLRLQNGRFDSPDRLFCSVRGAWEGVLRWNTDVKELIPQFYTPGCTSFLLNGSGTDFGCRTGGERVEDVELPPWATSADDFLEKMAAALEAPLVSARLHKWIDLVFGVKQRGAAAVQADNVFHFLTDDEMAVKILERERDPALRSAYEAQMREFGRTPKQLFAKKHPKRKAPSKIARLIQACVCGAPPGATTPGGSPRPRRNRIVELE